MNPAKSMHPSLKIWVLTHRFKVKSLYKRSLECLRNRERVKMDLLDYRFQAIQLRAEFDKYKNEKDFRKVKKLMDDQEEAIKDWPREYKLKFPFSEGGINYQRDDPEFDAFLDNWHPLEKAQYPEFFAKREELKEDYLKLYEETYGDLLKHLHISKHDTLGIKKHDDP